ncbi:MAG: hypothetical protein N3E37_02135 [Candidatus Micrarchaeota archaeon]|nr:hypothetical protein [Candidatus Micrarchaeota archaeon]
MRHNLTFSHKNTKPDNVLVVKVGGKLALDTSDYPKRVADRIICLLDGTLPVTEHKLQIKLPNNQKDQELNIHVHHPLWSGSKYVSLRDKVFEGKIPDLGLCVVGCGPQLNQHIGDEKINGQRKYTPWELMGGVNGLANKVFYEQSAKVIFQQLWYRLYEVSKEWMFYLVHGHEILKGEAFPNQGATGIPYGLIEKSILTMSINEDKKKFIVLSSTSQNLPRDTLSRVKDGIKYNQNIYVPLNTNSDHILQFFSRYYIEQKSNVYAIVFMLKDELEQLLGHPDVRDGMYLKMQVLLDLMSYYRNNIHDPHENNHAFKIVLVGI